ncbi:F-box only protein 32-like isoform X2 [Lineus longissimus]|uniref:F-box only protein 32-like isoform X2 n=1 Tax=Lineus longissimus TaxID=88925 RepID=UPI002B4E1155
MPFLGRDWRSPGDSWVRTGAGWEQGKCWRQKFLENLNENIIARMIRFPELTAQCSKEKLTDNLHPTRGLQPHIHIPKGISKERKAMASISDAFNKLDMQSAVKDPRRFRYTCKILQLLINKKFVHLSGTSQKQIITVLEEAVKIVLKSETDVHFVHGLILDYHTALNNANRVCIGSSSLHKKHLELTEQMMDRLDKFHPTERKDDGQAMLLNLPDEVLRDILRRVTDHVDLLHTGATQTDLYQLVQEELLWKEMCFFHFTNIQLCSGLAKNECLDDCNWKWMYRKLVRRHGKKELYAVQVYLCSNCNALFWKSHGHPCPCSDPEMPPHSIAVSPDAFINIFFY